MPVTATAAYPPEPWHLRAEMHLSLWQVPVADLPPSFAAATPAGVRPVVAARRAVVGAAFVRYLPGGVLTYDELLAATLVLDEGRPRVTIGDIWVDSPPSLAGGRDLWCIPKVAARFDRRQVSPSRVRWRARRDGAVLAEALVEPGVRVPGAWRLPVVTTQHLDGCTTATRVRTTAAVRLARAAWRFPAGSPLGFLTGRRPWTSVVLDDVDIEFGSSEGSLRR